MPHDRTCTAVARLVRCSYIYTLIGNAVLVYAALSSLALGFQYHEDGGPDKCPPSVKILRQCLALLGLEVVCVAHLDDSKETREDVRADPSDERAIALVLVVDGGCPRLGSVHPARTEE
jgi:hypothetical protein